MMLKKLMISAAIGGLMVGAAAAQGTPAPQKPNGAPAASAPAPAAKPAEASKPAPAAKSEAGAPTAAAKSAEAGKIVNSQRADQYLASNFRGTDVVGPDNEKVGDVSDILFDKDGKVLAYVVSVGGFLGIGAKDVAMEPAAFEVVAGDKSKNEADKLKLAMTKDQLKQAASFEPYKAPKTTTGMGGSRPPAPGGSMPR